jgi:hypothetical protein
LKEKGDWEKEKGKSKADEKRIKQKTWNDMAVLINDSEERKST